MKSSWILLLYLNTIKKYLVYFDDNCIYENYKFFLQIINTYRSCPAIPKKKIKLLLVHVVIINNIKNVFLSSMYLKEVHTDIQMYLIFYKSANDVFHFNKKRPPNYFLVIPSNKRLHISLSNPCTLR